MTARRKFAPKSAAKQSPKPAAGPPEPPKPAKAPAAIPAPAPASAPASRSGPAAGPAGPPTRAEWCARIRAARAARGISQADAGRMLGMSQQTYAQYERDTVPTLTRAWELVFSLEYDPAILFPELVGS